MAKDRFDHLFLAPADFDRTVAFYRDSLGWSSIAAWGSSGEPRGVILNGGDIEIVLAERHDADDHSWSHGSNGQRPTLHLAVENLDERFRELSSAVDVVVNPEATHWGTRWFVVKDPDGNLLAFEQHATKASEP